MPQASHQLRETADYIAQMLEELRLLARPLRNKRLQGLLAISADIARECGAVNKEVSNGARPEQRSPVRRKTVATKTYGQTWTRR